MPPTGKIPASTAALRTTSTALAISTRASRLAEYSSVKCGIADTSRGFFDYVLQAVSGEVTAHGAVRSIISLTRVAFGGFDRTDERSRQHHLTGFERQSMRRDLVGQPRDAGGGMVEHTGGQSGFFQL